MSQAGETPLMVRHEGKWEPLQVQQYKNEEELQHLIHETPSLLPGVSASAVAVREMTVPNVGAVDLVIVDTDGAITLVECKLQSNYEIKRKVIGQVLAYASGFWRLSYDEFDALFAARDGRSIEVNLSERTTDADFDPGVVRGVVASALSAGAFRLCIAVDGITDELRNIVEYLNTHTTNGIEILLFEVGIVTHGDVEILVPRAFGGESARLKAGPAETTGAKWSVDDVLTEVGRVSGPAAEAAIRKLHETTLANGWQTYPGKGATPAMTFSTKIDGKPRALLTVYPYESGHYERSVTINFESQASLRPQVTMDALLDDLEAIPPLAVHLTAVRAKGFEEYTLVPISTIAEPGVADAIAQAWTKHLAGQ